MVVTELYDGQGLGNQLWCYFVTRIIAEKNGYDFGVMGREKFKARDFMSIDFGKSVIGGRGPEGGPPSILPDGIERYYKEKVTFHTSSRLDVSLADPGLINIGDNTKIDGTMQSYNYVRDHKKKIIDWIEINQEKEITQYNHDNICIVHIRGGDYMGSQAILGGNYYKSAMELISNRNEKIKFYGVTDDVNYTRRILPDLELVGSSITGAVDQHKGSHHLGGPIWSDYSIIKNAKNLILSASSFGWWPAWTNPNSPFVIAPKYWAAHSMEGNYWSCGESLVDEWNYIDKYGNFFTGEECADEMKLNQ